MKKILYIVFQKESIENSKLTLYCMQVKLQSSIVYLPNIFAFVSNEHL